MDFFPGEIREALEEPGLWDSTMLVVLADHNNPAATIDTRVTLIIKLPNMNQRIDFDGLWAHAQFLPFLEELFEGAVFEPEAVAAIARKRSSSK